VFAKGYILYFHPERLSNSKCQAECEQILLEAMKLDTNHERAQLYLGHHYYDIGQYHKALACFAGVHGDRLIPLLYIKAKELEAYCRMLVEQDLRDAMPALETFFCLAQEASEYDVFPMIDHSKH
jgi:hypothetical protein